MHFLQIKNIFTAVGKEGVVSEQKFINTLFKKIISKQQIQENHLVCFWIPEFKKQRDEIKLDS